MILPLADLRERPGFVVEAHVGTVEDALLLACCYGGSRSSMCAITPAGAGEGFLLWRDERATVPLDLDVEAIAA